MGRILHHSETTILMSFELNSVTCLLLKIKTTAIERKLINVSEVMQQQGKQLGVGRKVNFKTSLI